MLEPVRAVVETCRIDSPLGSWTQSHWEPEPGDPLAGAVERIWDFEGTLGCRRERVFPNGRLELVVQLDEPHRPVSDADVGPFPALCIDGLATQTALIEGPRGRCRVLGVSLHPCGAFALLGTALGELSGRSVDLRAVIGRPADELAESIDAARHGAERVRAAERWARERLVPARRADSLIATVVRRIERDPARSILQIDELTGRSRSRFAAAFRDQIGLAPKRYARIVRFRRAMELLNADRFALSAVASLTGYFDQAHLSDEFRQHAGLSPQAYAKALRFPNSSHLAETQPAG